MKPDWKDAPSWAKFVACDRDGDWWWFERQPHCDDGVTWHSSGGKGMAALAGLSEEVVLDSLERRP